MKCMCMQQVFWSILLSTYKKYIHIRPIRSESSCAYHGFLYSYLKRKLRCGQRGMKRKALGKTWRGQMSASWIREQTRVEDTLMIFKKNKKPAWVGCIVHITQTDNQSNKGVTQKLQKLGQTRSCWRANIRSFAGTGWSTLACRECWKKPLYGKSVVFAETNDDTLQRLILLCSINLWYIKFSEENQKQKYTRQIKVIELSERIPWSEQMGGGEQ